MANAFLSTPFQVMIDRINTSRDLLEFFRGTKFTALLRRLKNALTNIQGFLMDAEQKEHGVREVRHWLTELKDTFYFAEDLLGEVCAEALRRRVDTEEGGFAGLFRNLWGNPDTLQRKIEVKMEDIVRKLEHLYRHTEVIGLREYSGLAMPFQRPRSQATPDIHETRLFGRDDDKNALLHSLMFDDIASSENLHVTALVGMPGIGKTALLQNVFSDSRLNEVYNLRAWVSVGESFDIFKVTEAALQELTQAPPTVEDLHSRQVQLKKFISGKKFFLVLDDVWSVKISDWEAFLAALMDGARGSKILISTRSSVVASTTQAVSHRLRLLSEEDCWDMLSKLAFGNRQLGSPSSQLEAIGKVIAKSCKGLPLVVRAVASHLSSLQSPEDWFAVSRNLPNYLAGLLDVVKPSYDSLPSHLKRCFAYLSIFPKGYEFEKEKLILLWMAEDLLQQPRSNRRFEDVGEEYFQELFSQSFFEESESRFIMHDLINDLAKSVSGEFCFRFEDGAASQISNKVRHLSFSGSKSDAAKIFESIQETMFLRTIIPFDLPQDLESHQLTDKVLKSLISKLQYLRVLCLSHYRVAKVPKSIGGLKHLRYLDLSSTDIHVLPDTVCSLYNLQVLLLSNCRLLARLPTNIGRLVNLRFLDLLDTPLKEMPIGINRLRSLQALSNFVVGNLTGAGLHELRELSSLHGTLHISELQNVSFSTEAKQAGLKKKQSLEGLVLKWSPQPRRYFGGRVHPYICDQSEVLEMLEPHPNLKSLSIECYRGSTFPNWIGDPSFLNILFIHLSSCSCLSLPPLGQLPALKDLIIEKLDRIQKVGLEFYGRSGPIITPFQSLQTLKFYGMLRWEEWSFPDVEGSAFPSLKKLHIQRCPKLIQVFPGDLPDFTEVTILECPLQGPRKTDLLREASSAFSGSGSVRSGSDEHSLGTSARDNPSSDEHSTGTVQENPGSGEHAIGTGQDNPEGESEHAGVSDEPFPMKDTMGPADAELVYRMEDETSSQFSEGLDVYSERSYEFGESSVQPTDSLSILGKHSYQHSLVGSSMLGGLPASGIQRAPIDIPPLASIQHDKRDTKGIGDIPNFESFKVSEASQLLELPPDLRGLRIERCDGLTTLPDGLMGDCPYLQDLFIIDCTSFRSFSGGYPPAALKTLYIFGCQRLEFIHKVQAMHQYSLLEHLYIGSSCAYLRSFPLAFFPKLKSLSIHNCPKFSSISVPGGLAEDRISLEALEIRDCPNLILFPEGGLPTPKLSSILLSNCLNLEALPENLYRLDSLESLIINECPEIRTIGARGFPPSLTTLCVYQCDNLIATVQWQLQNLENLHNLEIDGGTGDMQFYPEDMLLPRNLYSLRISGFQSLTHLNFRGSSQLTSLEMLEITRCDSLESLPDEGLPSSLSYLGISDCPSLTAKLHEKGIEWYKVSHIAHVKVNGEVIS